MDNMVSLRIELGISAQRIIQQLTLDHKTIEEQVQKGVELALDELLEGDSLVNHIKRGTKQAFSEAINSVLVGWEFKSKMEEAIQKKMAEKIEEHANKIAAKIAAEL